MRQIMVPWTISTPSLALLYLAFGVESSGLKTTKFNRSFESSSNLIFTHDQLLHKHARGSSWTYAICDFVENNPTKCSIVLETNKLDGLVYRDQCQISLEDPRVGYIEDYHLRVFPLGSDKSIVVWHSNNNIAHFYTIRFPDCKITEAKMKLEQPLFNWHSSYGNNNNVRVLVHDDETYDVFYANKTKNLIFWNRITFDASSSVVEGPKESVKLACNYDCDRLPKEEENVVDVTFSEVEEPEMGGYVMGTLNAKNLVTFWHIEKRGERRKLTSYTGSDDEKLRMVFTSTANGIFGICRTHSANATLTCEQYNRRGEKILGVEYETNAEFKYADTWMYNLRGGGFLIFRSPCEHGNWRDEIRAYVTKVDADGKRYRPLEVANYPEVNIRQRDGFFENGPNEICWYQLIGNKYDKPKSRRAHGYAYELTHTCFTISQLSEEY